MMALVICPDDRHAGGGGVTYERAQTNQEQTIAFLMRKADINLDGRLQFEEFKALMWCLRQETDDKDTASMVFAMFDLDSDSFICESEFREIYRFYLGHHPTYVEFMEQWSNLREDEDVVSKKRYIKWLQTNAHEIFRQHSPGAVAYTFADSDTGVLANNSAGFSQTISSGMSFWEESLMKKRVPKDAAGWPLAPKKNLAHRPLWDKKFNSKVIKNDELPAGERTYFSKSQSLPQLGHFYQTFQGFERQHRVLSAAAPPRKLRVLSTDTMEVFNPERHAPGGEMREHIEGSPCGEVNLWEDNWQTPLRYKSRLRPGTRPLPHFAFFDASHQHIGPMAKRLNQKYG